jgi:ParB family chromosome partitioning protein
MPEEEIAELAQSISEHGVLQPLLVRDIGMGYYELVSGERRLRAAEQAGLETVPAIALDPDRPESSLTISLVENVQRADLNPLELALAYRRLQAEFGRTQDDIARTVGKSRPHITNTLRLLELPEMIQAAVADGRITAGHARALLMAPEHSRFLIYQKIIQNDLNVRRAEKAARTATRKDSAPVEGRAETTDPAPGVVRDMELALESTLGRKVKIERRKNGKGRVSIEFYSDSDLTALVEKLRG